MKRNYLIATHGELAKGIQSSLNILAGKGDDVTVINAYMTDEDYTPVIVDFIKGINENEQGVIFTDLFGGSVNQKVVTEVVTAGREDIFILSNVNLAIILSILFLPEESAITTEMIQEAINESQVTLVQTNQNDEAEDIF
ncbi:MULTISPECIES: PTS sugar transporter subunit IIA [Vagococcus]|uniref:PTS system, mannose-specific IIA component n=1 Tax=Vagococcus fluvialis bH819 TaxID=1255619 RepID=A0A1X6WNX3_9ENTE|nr:MULTISPECIES: PTS sugar transporter subunit IIA [Vagococcus]SLM85958.1 PTS system, mannose-specific IIA component [Vagococcus fluvialis bH819]HCM88325.1 PTS mannose transporter subunit IIA [Vagococcus sp.]